MKILPIEMIPNYIEEAMNNHTLIENPNIDEIKEITLETIGYLERSVS